MSEIKMKAEARSDKSTRKSLNEIRGARQIPAIVYGGKGDNINVSVVVRDLKSALKEGGHNAIIHLQHEKGEDTVIVKAIQKDVVTNLPIHVDFQRISLTEKIEVAVPIELVGESPGVKMHGGVQEHVTREIAILALPNKIPQHIDVDVSKLNIGDGIHVKDLQAIDGCEVIDDGDKIVVHIVHATKEEEVAPAAEGEGEAGAEPEVIAKGKKDEEGAEGADGAKGDDKKDAGKKDAGKK
jgi:large subunit ribosomal protein L25